MTHRSNPPARKRPLTWRAIDLHLHTPASSDYQEPQATYLQVLQTAEARGLDIIAFTDHNTVAGYRQLQEELAELELLERLKRLTPEEQQRLSEYRRLLAKILVLPGFEFTATFGFHILGLFAPTTPVRDIEHLLLSLNVPSDQLDKGSATVGATADVLTAYQMINAAGGLVIAAHANSTNGVAMRGFNFGGQTKIAYTQDSNLYALEVTDLEQKGRRTTAAFFNGSKPEYPRRMHCLQGSDAHRLTRDPNNSKTLGIGDRATDVLMDEPTFEALQAVFLGSDFACLRPHVQGAAQSEFDYVQQAREEGPSIVQDFHEAMTPRGGKLYGVITDVCGFANTNGGTLYLGVSRDPKQAPVGVLNTEQAIRELRTAIDRQLTPRLTCTVDTHTSRGKTIVRVLVPRGDDPPYAVDDSKIYLREEAETSLAVRDEIVQLVLRRYKPGDALPLPVPVEVTAPPAKPRVATETPSPTTPLSDTHANVAAPHTEGAPRPEGAPRTGVEIVATEERGGVRYHTMHDLRNNSVVKNVTRSSARKLWHYAIAEREAGHPKPETVTWLGDLGLYKKREKGGVMRYDLAQRTPDGLRVYFGVTEEGIHGEWKKVAGFDASASVPAASAPALSLFDTIAGVVATEAAPMPEVVSVSEVALVPEAPAGETPVSEPATLETTEPISEVETGKGKRKPRAKAETIPAKPRATRKPKTAAPEPAAETPSVPAPKTKRAPKTKPAPSAPKPKTGRTAKKTKTS